MDKYAQLENNIVILVIESESDPDGINGEWILCNENVGPGWVYDGNEFTAPEPLPPETDPCEFLLDLGPFADRLYPFTIAVDMATDPRVVAINKDLSRRKYINLKDPRVAATLGFLAGDTLPGLGALETPLITQEVKTYALTAPVTLEENRSLRAQYFKGYGL